ncbi:MAG: hypothetical protein ACRCVJ_07380 [Clostridium sp.]|uniref:hypothetical protein n=1 Tax=Clostridium sp. TaxID=1506 RepID=UPI003F3B83FA
MNPKDSNKNMNSKIDGLTNQVKMLELIIRNSSSCDEAMQYFGEGSPDYIDTIIDNATQVLGD